MARNTTINYDLKVTRNVDSTTILRLQSDAEKGTFTTVAYSGNERTAIGVDTNFLNLAVNDVLAVDDINSKYRFKVTSIASATSMRGIFYIGESTEVNLPSDTLPTRFSKLIVDGMGQSIGFKAYVIDALTEAELYHFISYDSAFNTSGTFIGSTALSGLTSIKTDPGTVMFKLPASFTNTLSSGASRYYFKFIRGSFNNSSFTGQQVILEGAISVS